MPFTGTYPSTPETRSLQIGLQSILASVLKPASVKVYQRNWEAFHQFCTTTLKRPHALPADATDLCLFLTHLAQKGLAYRTITTYTSAISFVHKMHQYPDPSAVFIVNKTLQGIRNNTAQTTKSQLSPITKPILRKLITALPEAFTSLYSRKLWAAVFALTYHACLRAGEAVQSNTLEHTLKTDQVTIQDNTIHIKFRSYKHSTTTTPTMVLQQDVDPICCPVYTLRQYLQLRSNKGGPIFIDQNQSPIDRQLLSSTLKAMITLIGLKPENYNTHSFRIGRATQLAQDNHSYATIQTAGRWHSSAYLRYIRPNSITLPN